MDIAIVEKSSNRTLMNWFGLDGAIAKARDLSARLGCAIIVTKGGGHGVRHR